MGGRPGMARPALAHGTRRWLSRHAACTFLSSLPQAFSSPYYLPFSSVLPPCCEHCGKWRCRGAKVRPGWKLAGHAAMHEPTLGTGCRQEKTRETLAVAAPDRPALVPLTACGGGKSASGGWCLQRPWVLTGPCAMQGRCRSLQFAPRAALKPSTSAADDDCSGGVASGAI